MDQQEECKGLLIYDGYDTLAGEDDEPVPLHDDTRYLRMLRRRKYGMDVEGMIGSNDAITE